MQDMLWPSKKKRDGKEMKTAIVVVAFDRAAALDRLLRSVGRAQYDRHGDVPLIISIDGGGDPGVIECAESFHWAFGEKVVIRREGNLGLREHVLRAGDLVENFDAIIMLEDDVLASPQFYEYGAAALQAYNRFDEIGGVSLYAYRFLDINALLFSPMAADGDVFLVRFPSSWGQAWTKGQWLRFRAWMAKQEPELGKELDSLLPPRVAAWPASSWKKSFARYLVDTDRYVVYPVTSLTTNMGDAGFHWGRATLVFQVPLQATRKEHRFLEPSMAISYDQFFELEARSLALLPPAPGLPEDLIFDLYGEKPLELLRDRWVITSKKVKSHVHSFGFELLPQEMNVLLGIGGKDFVLAEGSEVLQQKRLSRTRLLRHETSFLGGRDFLKLLAARIGAAVARKR